MSNMSAAVSDTIPVGSPDILLSPHVSEGPGRIAKAPVPSIYVDDRGDIHRLRVGSRRINLLYSVAHVMRSGYLHPHSMHDIVIRGKVEVWTLTTKGTVKTIYQKYDHFTVDPYTPHILHFLEDTTIAEWWDGPEFSCWYYHPFRKIIDVQNSVTAVKNSRTGMQQRLIPQDEVMIPTQSWTTSMVTATFFALGLVSGLAIGVAMGELKNERR